MENFLSMWHDLEEVVPDGTSDIFFVVGEEVLVGKYDSEVEGFMMADRKGYGVEETEGKWMYVPPLRTPKAFPQPGQRIVASINEYSENTPFRGVDVMGTFIEDRTGRYFDVCDIYDITGTLYWDEDIDGWQDIPEKPCCEAKSVPDTQSVNLADVDNIKEEVELTPNDVGMKKFPGEKPYLPKDGENIDVRCCGKDYYQKGNYNAAENVFVYKNPETGDPESVSFDEIEVWEPARIYK